MMMKKIWKISLLLVLCVSFLLTGCSATTLSQPETVALEAADYVPPVMNTTAKFKGKTLQEYYSENEDTIGWLKVDGIKTDNVVLLGQKNKEYAQGDNGKNHYLYRTFDHQYSPGGELYIDHRGRITPEIMSQNITVYGHHMKDGTMLAGLDHYKKQSFYEEHPFITFDTLWGTYYYRVFGVFTVNLKVQKDADFDYRQPEYESEEAFLKFIQEVKERSYYENGVEVKGDDRIITLSTCTYPTGRPGIDNARLVVMGRMCTPEEVEQITKSATE